MATVDPAAARSRRSRPSKAPLSEASIVEAGIRVLQAEGLDAVTMRRVAAELDTGAASLYVYVGSRDDLTRLMFDRVAMAVPVPEPDPARWREQLMQICTDLLQALEDHPGIATILLGNVPVGEGAMRGAESMLALLLAGGIDAQRAAWACDALFLIIVSTAIETVVDEHKSPASRSREQPSFSHLGVSYSDLRERFAALPADRFPHIVANAEALTTGDSGTRFRFAVQTFIDGLLVEKLRRGEQSPT